MRLDNVFPKEVIKAGPNCTIGEVAALMDENGVGTVVVTEKERPVGIVTDRDVAIELGTGRVVRSEPVSVIMTKPVATVGCHEGIFAATRHLRANSVRRLPIVDEGGRVVGVVSVDDLLIMFGRELGNLASSIGQELALAKGISQARRTKFMTRPSRLT